MKNPKQALLGRLPKRYHDRVIDFTEEDGLIDECKYILHYSHDYTDGECKGGTLPCRSIREACEFVRDLVRVNSSQPKPNDEINNQQPKEPIEVYIDRFKSVRKSNNLYCLRGNNQGKEINYIVAFSADGKTSDYVIDICGLKMDNIIPNEPVVLKGFTTYERAKEFVEDYFKKAKARKAEAYKEMKERPFDENAKARYRFIKSSCAMAKNSMCIVYVSLKEWILQ